MPLDPISPISPSAKPAALPKRLPTLRAAVTLFSGQAARQGYLAAIDQGTISLANFLATILLARNVSPTELGLYGVGFIALRLIRSIQEGIVVQPVNMIGASMDSGAFRRLLYTRGEVANAGSTRCSPIPCGWR